MFKTLRSKIIAWLLSLIGLAAASTTVVPYQQFMPGLGGIAGGISGAGSGGGGGVGVATIDFLQCTGDGTGQTVYTFSGQNTGTAGTDRDTIVVVFGEDNATTFGVSGVTIGGDAATEIVDDDGTVEVNTAIYIFSNDAGTSEDIVVTFSEAVTQAGICVYDAHDLSSTTAVASTEDANSTGAAVTVSANFTGEGVAVGGCASEAGSESTTWVGIVENFDAGNMGGANTSWSAAKYSSLTTSAPLVITCDWTGAADVSGVAATFR